MRVASAPVKTSRFDRASAGCVNTLGSPLPMDENAVRGRALLDALCKASAERNAEIVAMAPDDPRRPDIDMTE